MSYYRMRERIIVGRLHRLSEWRLMLDGQGWPKRLTKIMAICYSRKLGSFLNLSRYRETLGLSKRYGETLSERELQEVEARIDLLYQRAKRLLNSD